MKNQTNKIAMILLIALISVSQALVPYKTFNGYFLNGCYLISLQSNDIFKATL